MPSASTTRCVKPKASMPKPGAHATGLKKRQGAQEGRKALVGERSVETQSRKSLRIAVEREMIILKRSVSQGIVIIFGS